MSLVAARFRIRPPTHGIEVIVEGTIHPLLVYAEMVQTRDERVLEAASAVRRRFLPEFA